jgi:Tol biopolymer transport system component
VSLSPGTRVGPYEVTAPIGAGGMGEVCRARDTKLNRDVALKVLPADFATDPDRMTRFQREAQLLAALNHPNIAAIYGLEDAGTHQAIVMELVEGSTLTGPLPVSDALHVAKQIADAVEYAHERGIIHRDLKPANIKVSPDGIVKVLDFGLAKALDDVSDVAMSPPASMSPTLSIAATHAGVIMGTAAYMAPEQAKGRPADRKSDIWSFAVVLYEVLTGARIFGGDSVSETLASVMKDPITLRDLPVDTPAAIRRILTRCLERDPRRRLQSIGEARIAIEDAISNPVSVESAPTPPAAAHSSGWPWLVAAMAMLAAVAAIGWTWSRPAPAAPPVLRYTITPAEGTILTTAAPNASLLAVSPNGKFVVYVADEKGRGRILWVRALDSLDAQRIDRTDGAMFPFWSPDSQHVAYFANGKLMRVALAGGAPLTICDVLSGEGGTWYQTTEDDGVIVFADSPNSALSRVPARGGLPTSFTTLADDETGHSFPQFLPGGDRVLYLARGKKSGIYMHSLRSKERTFILDTIGRATYAPPGLLLYMRDTILLAQRWNADTLKLEGDPVTIAEDVRTGGGNGRNAFAASASGVLAYRAGSGVFHVRAYTRDGAPEEIVVEPAQLGPMSVSPDETQIVLPRGGGSTRDLWIADLRRRVFSPLTSMADSEQDAVWAPDSRRVAYVNTDGRTRKLYFTVIGSGRHAALPVDMPEGVLEAWTPDGQFLVLRRNGTIMLVPAPREDGTLPDTKVRTVFDEKYNVGQIRISPNGKWVAYMSVESTRPQVTVASFPSFTDRRPVSNDVTTQPVWRGDGKELFFLGVDQKLMAVDVDAGPQLRLGPVKDLFHTNIVTNTAVHMYGVARDGRRILIREAAGGNGTIEPLYIVSNWTSLVP